MSERSLYWSKQITAVHQRLFGNGTGEFAKVVLHFEAAPPGTGVAFENETGYLPQAYVAAVGQAVRDALIHGADPTLQDVRVTLVDGAYHEVDSTPATFSAAARAALEQLRREMAS